MSQLNISAPLDKQSRPMRLLVQIDFAQLPLRTSELPECGVLAVFVSDDIDKCQPKDKHCFKVIWQSPMPSAPHVVPARNATREENEDDSKLIATSVADCFLLGNEHPKLTEAQAICAFSANGITYNEARAQDDCYSHLIAQASSWRLLLRLNEKATDYLLLINKDDLSTRHLDKAWLVRFKGNS